MQVTLLVGQLQIKLRESLPQISVEPFCIPLVLEIGHEIIGKPTQTRLALKPKTHFFSPTGREGW